jgi:thiamine biosynthesis protein ThiI
MKTYIVHYGELGLKGRNRRQFEQQLIHNIRLALGPFTQPKVIRFHSYIVVEIPEADGNAQASLIEDRLARVPGIAYFAPALRVPPTMAAISEAGLQLAHEMITPETTFKVDTQRGDKSFPMTSVAVNRDLGAQVVDALSAPVQLNDPEVTLGVQIYPDHAYVFARRIEGVGGLPVGVSGRVLILLSGGIDSPVAAHMMLKRGCNTDFLHFHVLPDREQIHDSKVVHLARKVMEPHQLPARLYMLPAYPFQMALLEIDSPLELVIFRRFVMRVAAQIAGQWQKTPHKALALVTGDSLGQVASQTLQNIRVISRAVKLPILRPLIGFDKLEIIALAKQLGTYEISIKPYKDPCAMHARHPATWARLKAVQDLEAELELDTVEHSAVIEETLAQMELIEIAPGNGGP